MRLTFMLTAMLFAMPAVSSPAQQSGAANPEAPGGADASVIEGRHHQPSAAEIERRERATGESEQAIRAHARQQDKVIDDLYKELMTPVPSRERSGAAVDPAQ